MTARTIGLALALAIVQAGCTYARGVGSPAALAPGRPEFVPGLTEGYWIWQDSGGWHLRTTSDLPRRFHGELEPVGGAISSVRAVGGAPEPQVGGGGDRIVFDWQAEGGERGIDWIASSGCTRFQLYIDGDPRPTRVFLGGPSDSPDVIPFAVCRPR